MYNEQYHAGARNSRFVSDENTPVQLTASFKIKCLFVLLQQLNWTAKPFVGDIQITWSFHLHVHAGVLQRLLAAVLFFSRHSSNYRHLWRTGLLLRVGEVSIDPVIPPRPILNVKEGVLFPGLCLLSFTHTFLIRRFVLTTGRSHVRWL